MSSNLNHKIQDQSKIVLLLVVVITILILGYLVYRTIQNVSLNDSAAATTYLTDGRLYGPNSPFSRKIPTDAIYTKDIRIGSVRGSYSDYAIPYVRNQAGQNVPTVKVTNTYTGTVDYWPIPTNATPNSGSDAWLGVIDPDTHKLYEFWEFKWDTSTTPKSVKAGGNFGFDLGGTGLTKPGRTISASGLAVSGGSAMKEDFTDPITGQYDTSRPINHALEMGLNHALIKINDYVAPATQGEDFPDNTGDIPLGALYALPKNFDVESLTGINPLTKSIARAMRDYGVYVADRNSASNYQNKYVGTLPMEATLAQDVFGKSNDTLILTTQSEIYNIIQQAGGLYRVTGIDFSYTCDSTQIWDATLKRCKPPGNTVCYTCTAATNDGNACISFSTVAANCAPGTTLSPTGCTSTGGGSCPTGSNAVTCYRCTDIPTDNNTCESFIANSTCPAGSTSSSGQCAQAAGGSCISGGGAVCGNTIVETGEACDDGNSINTDQCSNDCLHKCTLPQIWNGTACITPVQTCTSFTYTDWSACSTSGIQTRTVVSASPAGCTGGNPVTQQTCTPGGGVTCGAADEGGTVGVFDIFDLGKFGQVYKQSCSDYPSTLARLNTTRIITLKAAPTTSTQNEVKIYLTSTNLQITSFVPGSFPVILPECENGTKLFTATNICTHIKQTTPIILNQVLGNISMKFTAIGPARLDQDSNFKYSDGTTEVIQRATVTSVTVGCGSKDLNGDGKVDIVDLSIFAKNYGLANCATY